MRLTQPLPPHLQQAAEFIEVFNAGLGVNQATLVAEGCIAAHQHVAGNGLAEHVDTQHILQQKGGCEVRERGSEGGFSYRRIKCIVRGVSA